MQGNSNMPVKMNRKDSQGKTISQIGCGINCNLVNNSQKKKKKNLATKEGECLINFFLKFMNEKEM
jgi:adenine C2-methylase RlmN of 23S rRNA A2503 and tRNA A37